MSLSEVTLCPDLTPSPFLFEDQLDPDPGLQDFHKGGYKHSICPGVCGGRGAVRHPATEKSGNLTLKGARVETEGSLRARMTSCPASTSSSLSILLSAPSWHCSSRRKEEGRLGPLLPRVL
uniref:Uncharacterized protein n=1 Tax=Molossus molossus TaxID=27622 RepID=A0A7J8ERZ8_MOLMO|nr:hypothetical protein HJG59_008766 [Molossus molossus]